MSNTYSSIREWPSGLLDELYGDDSVMLSLPYDFEGSLSYVLYSLGDRTREIILQRYQERLTLEDIAKLHGVTRERIRQVIAKGIRMLRHPSRRRMIEMGVAGYIAFMQQEASEKAATLAEREALKNHLLIQREDPDGAKAAEKATLYTMDIAELGLSVRAYNCLKRSCVNTIGELLELTSEQLARIRNLGKKSHDEVVTALTAMGFDCVHLKRKEDKHADGA